MALTNETEIEIEWLVLLEAVNERERSTIDASSFARLVCSWATRRPTTLYSPNRYALQVAVRASDPPSALSTAISLWRDALDRTELPEWQLVRAEIMTPEELEQELQAAEWRGDRPDVPSPAPHHTPDVVADDLLRRALHDSVTGLPSREVFLDGVRRALATDAKAPSLQAMMIVQLEGIDTVNPSLAFSMGDDTVVAIAGRLTDVTRRRDTVARVGPTEFALLIEAGDGKDTDCLARRIVDVFRGPPLGEGVPPAVRASVGVAMSSWTDDPDQLILMAEVAAADAREAGGNCHRTFAPDPDSV